MIRVLVVDNHPLLREGIAAVLGTQPDMRVQAEATEGREAVDLYDSLRPDVVLMDLQMPGMDGISAIRAIREQDPAARIVVLTTHGGDVQAQLCLQGAGVSVLPRPLGDRLPGLERLDLGEEPPGRDTWLGYHRDLRRLARLRALVDFVVARFGA